MPQGACQKFNLRLEGDTPNSRSSKYHPTTATKQKQLAYLRESMPQKNSFNFSAAHCCRRWHKFLELSIPNWNTMYLIKIGMKPCPKIHGRKSYNIPDQRFRLKGKTCCASTTFLADEILKRIRIFSIKIQIRWRSHSLVAKKIVTLKQKLFHCKEDYYYVSQPKADHQVSKIPIWDFRYFVYYVIEDLVLP